MAKKTKLETLVKDIAVTGACIVYNIDEDTLKQCDAILRKEESSSISENRKQVKKGIDKISFLEIVGAPPDKLSVATGSITYCLKQQIERNPTLSQYNVTFGVHKTNGPEDDQVIIKRLRAIDTETE